MSYDEYGVVLEKDESIQSRFLYNGKYGVQTDSNGLYHMRARYYNPDLKRFMNRDVVSGNIIESQTLNRYAFVNGNPISYHDPFGLAREAIANANMSLMDRLHIGLDIAGMLPVIGEVADGLNAVLYLSKGDYTNALLSGMAMIPVVGNASTVAKYADDVAFLGKKGYNEIKGLSQPIIHNKPVAGDNVGVNFRGNNKLLPNEGDVGTYKELIDAGTRGDNITPHHMPSAKYMSTNAGVRKNDGVSMNMEQPHPGKGGRHRQTETYGMTGEKLQDYLNLKPRDALARDIVDARNIYIQQGLYTPEVRSGLLAVIKLNKTKYPKVFEK